MAAALPIIAIAASVAGTAMSAIGQYRAGQAQEAANEYNAQITERKAVQEEQASRDRLRKLMGTQRAMYAKAGVNLSSGSPLLVLAETAAEGEKEALNIRYGGQEESNLQRFYGTQAKKAGTIGAASTLLTGLGQAGTSYYDLKKKP